jgi:hypothetical protein
MLADADDDAAGRQACVGGWVGGWRSVDLAWLRSAGASLPPRTRGVRIKRHKFLTALLPASVPAGAMML